jgi:guanyl-specific ribonuclease Sa
VPEVPAWVEPYSPHFHARLAYDLNVMVGRNISERTSVLRPGSSSGPDTLSDWLVVHGDRLGTGVALAGLAPLMAYGMVAPFTVVAGQTVLAYTTGIATGFVGGRQVVRGAAEGNAVGVADGVVTALSGFAMVGPGVGSGPRAGVARITPGALPPSEEAAVLATLRNIDAGTKPAGALAKRWGVPFKNWSGDLPGPGGPSSPYQEYRVAPPPGTSGAGIRRVVVDPNTGDVYYTWTHYGDTGSPAFVQIR